MVSLRHEFVAISCDENTIFLEANVTYTRHDGSVVTVPAMSVFVVNETGGDLVATTCRIYVDLGPLFAPSQVRSVSCTEVVARTQTRPGGRQDISRG